MDFIPAKESKFVIWFFYQYTRFMLKRRFRNVIIHQQYFPKPGSQTMYFSNHNYWWDGLIPLYVNNKLFKQQARALMEDKQMKQYPFFSRIGAFSIDLDNPKSSIKSLRYGLDSLKRPNSCLFIYPEGKITSVSGDAPVFKDGLAWLVQKSTDVDVVPIALYIDYSQSNKPDLYISIGNSLNPDKSLPKKELTEYFQEEIHEALGKLKSITH